MTKTKNGLRRDIGVGSLTAIGLGSIIGSGVFSFPASMAAVAGPSMILAIILAGCMTTFLALSYAELGAAFPMTGGPFAIPRLSMGDLVGFIMGWGYFLYAFVGTAAILNIFVVYLGYLIPGLSVGMTLTPLGTAIALVLVWVFTALNVLGVRWGALYSIITTICKFIPLAIFCAIGLMRVDVQAFEPFVPFGIKGITIATTLCIFSYAGFEAMTVPGEEIQRPKRSIPIAIILTMIVTILTYALVSLSFLAFVHWDGLGLEKGSWQALGDLQFPLANVATNTPTASFAWLALVLVIGAMISTGGAGGTWVLIQGRVPFAMAEQGLFWEPIKKLNHNGVPARGLVLSSIGTSIILLLLRKFVSVALVASITALLPYGAAVISLPILRKQKPDIVRHFAVPFHRMFTMIAFVFVTWLIYWACWPWTIVGTALLLLGFPAFYLIRTKHIEFKRSLWIIVYLLGIDLVSYLGDTQYVLDNFTNLVPLGWLVMPWDLVVLALFSCAIFLWAYQVNVHSPLGKRTVHT